MLPILTPETIAPIISWGVFTWFLGMIIHALNWLQDHKPGRK